MLVTSQQAHDSALARPLWALLADEKFRASIEALSGYSATETGLRVVPADRHSEPFCRALP